MKLRPQFGIQRSFILLTSCCFLLMVHQILNNSYTVPNFFGVYPNHCVKQPWVIYRGWPMHTRTDVTALHPEHEKGPCHYNSSYHPLGLVCNTALAISVGAVLSCVVAAGPRFLTKQIALRWKQ